MWDRCGNVQNVKKDTIIMYYPLKMKLQFPYDDDTEESFLVSQFILTGSFIF